MTTLTFSVPWAALISDNRKYVTGIARDLNSVVYC